MSPRFLLPLLLVASAAHATTREDVWAYEDWTPSSPVGGTDGWVNGYAGDPWVGSRTGENLFPAADDNVGDSFGNGYGSGWAADNWLIRGPDFAEGGVAATLGNFDNDAMGVVLNHDGDDTFYLLYQSEDSAPPPVDEVPRSQLVLMRVQDGDVTVMRRADVPALSSDETFFRLEREGTRLRAYYAGQLAFAITDNDPLPAGGAGAYAYDNGPDFNGNVGYFARLSAYRVDTDEDGVVNDEDNCIVDPNPGQADDDGDGIGDACDEDFEPGGDDTDDPSDTDTDDPSDTDPGDPGDPNDTDPSSPGDTDDDAGLDPDEGLRVACEGCAGSPAPAGGLLLLVPFLALRRRR